MKMSSKKGKEKPQHQRQKDQDSLHTAAPSASGASGSIRFIPERTLGTGGLCDVFAARDLLRLEYDDGFPHVAVKRLLPKYEQNATARRLLAREFFITRHISHPGVARVFDLHEEKGSLLLSMELLSGRNLYELAGQRPAGLGTAALPLARQLFETLALLHSLGIAHGDIKPANLMLEKGDRLVLLDFNTADVIPQAGCAASHVCQSLRSSLGLTACSLLHASPERLEGRPPSFADDIFAACCTIVEVMEGAHPFARQTSLEARNAALLPPRLRIGKSRAGRMLLRGLSFNPAMRPAAHELAAACRPQGLAARWLSALCGC